MSQSHCFVYSLLLEGREVSVPRLHSCSEQARVPFTLPVGGGLLLPSLIPALFPCPRWPMGSLRKEIWMDRVPCQHRVLSLGGCTSTGASRASSLMKQAGDHSAGGFAGPCHRTPKNWAFGDPECFVLKPSCLAPASGHPQPPAHNPLS